MAGWVWVLEAESEDLSLISGTLHGEKRESTPEVVLCPPPPK